MTMLFRRVIISASMCVAFQSSGMKPSSSLMKSPSAPLLPAVLDTMSAELSRKYALNLGYLETLEEESQLLLRFLHSAEHESEKKMGDYLKNRITEQLEGIDTQKKRIYTWNADVLRLTRIIDSLLLHEKDATRQ